MNKLIILIVILLSIELNAQITIGPEVGMYHRPYLFRISSNGVQQNNLDYFFGVVGEVKLKSKLYALTRINYVERKNAYSGLIRNFEPDLKDATLTNMELNMYVDMMYEPFKNTKIGLGLGMIHKLNSNVQENFYFEDSVIKYYSPSINYISSIVISQNWGRFAINGRYFNLFKSENLDSNNSRVMNDRKGFTIGLSYKLFGYKK
jgi:hypothetical protein